MTGPEPAASQREVDALARRLDTLDEHGTRGYGPMTLQISELAKDYGELKSDLKAHQLQHTEDQRQRSANRKWWVTAVAGYLVTTATVIGMLWQVLATARGR